MKRAWLFSVVVVAGGAALAGCSGDNVTADGAAGSTAAAGSAGASAHPPAQGNMTLLLQQVKPTSCPVASKTYQVGNPQAPTSSSVGDRLIDGEAGAKVSCVVRGGGPYFFSGSIQGQSSELAKVTLIVKNGIIDADEQTGTATISVYTPELADVFHSTEGGCTVSVVAQNVKPGSLWATFSCPSVSSSSTGAACGIGAISTFVLENCEAS
ncbi:MAG TPA: hypothetical protein VJV79_05535 [Polyangiaceae bacterium]|nr:hypothetical protein [Polyangiaceae bacterium]